MKKINSLALVVVCGVVLSACAKKNTVAPIENQTQEMSTEPTTVPQESNMQEKTQEEESTESITNSSIALSAQNFSFSQKEIRAKAGETIIISLSNAEGVHDFVIDELGVKSKMLSAGDTQDLEIHIPADGKGKTFEYYCSVGQHRKMGMSGKLIIE